MYRSILFFLFAWVFNSCGSVPENSIEMILDPTREYQKMEGFGASDAWRCQFVGKYWPEEKRDQIADLLFSQEFDEQGDPRGIGLSLWRFYLGSGTASLGESSGIVNEWRRAECFQLPDGSYDWTRQEGQQWFLIAARKRGVEKYLAFSITPPVHMSKNGMGHSPAGDISMNIRDGKMGEYARFMADVLAHFQDQGLAFDFLSPFNEPQWNWDNNTQEGTAAQNGQLYELIAGLSAELDTRNLSAEIVAGEAGTINHLSGIVLNDSRDNQVEVFFGKESPMNLAPLPKVRHAITAHSYFTTWPLDTLLLTRERLADCMAQTDPGLEYWQTEFCILEKNDEIGQGGKRDLEMPTALYVARVIHADLVMNNASSWQWWTALSQCDYKDGLVYLDNGRETGMVDPESPMNDSLKYDGVVRESKLLWALGNYSRFIRPGAVRIDLQFDNPVDVKDQLSGLMASAFHDRERHQFILVFVNQSADIQTILLRNPGGTTFAPGKSVKVYITSPEKDLRFETVSLPSVDLDPQSVTTLIIPEFCKEEI